MPRNVDGTPIITEASIAQEDGRLATDTMQVSVKSVLGYMHPMMQALLVFATKLHRLPGVESSVSDTGKPVLNLTRLSVDKEDLLEKEIQKLPPNDGEKRPSPVDSVPILTPFYQVVGSCIRISF